MEINDSVIAIIGTNCRKLKSLDINNCPNVDDECAESLKSMQLLELNVANTKVNSLVNFICYKVPNDEIQSPFPI